MWMFHAVLGIGTHLNHQLVHRHAPCLRDL
jgi:hypothetical protein